MSESSDATQTKANEIEKAYNILLSYKQEVADFLLYVTGTHSHKEYGEHWIENSRKTIICLRDKRSEACILAGLLFQGNESEPEYVFSDGRIYTRSFLYAEYLDVSRNTANWINAANAYLSDWACLAQ